MDFLGALKAVALPKIIEILELFVKDSWSLRKQQALNAARPVYRTGAALTGGAVLSIPQAQQSDQVFSFLLFVTDENSGKGRYTLDSTDPNTATTPPEGLPIFNAGFEILIAGHENIKGFRAKAETGATLNYTYELFQ
jgi:hypothetical protein